MSLKTKKYFSHYIPLAGILAFAALGFSMFSYEKSLLLGVSVALSLSYIAWGVVHHLIHREFSLEVIFEYVAVAMLGLILLLSVIYWK